MAITSAPAFDSGISFGAVVALQFGVAASGLGHAAVQVLCSA